MSRDTGEFPGYAPKLRLCMRVKPEGGDVRIPCDAQWQGFSQFIQTDLLVLVHGFNNNRTETGKAYSAFRRRQEASIASDDQVHLEAMLGDAFWPGDADWPGPVDRVDFMVYPEAIKKCIQTAAALGDYLLQRTDVRNLFFVGHSLGCRVILEAIKYMIGKSGEKTVQKVCLMAAAVPTYMVCKGGDLYEALLTQEHVRILYSPDDPVLAVAAPLGETLGGDHVLPSAVGRYGDVPMTPGKIDRELVLGAGHSDYWGVKTDDASDISTERLSQFLGIGVGFRSLEAIPPPPIRPDPPRIQVQHRQIGHP
jgi:pimeloyl-ACP methyl ester carboxylesterase